MKVLLFEQWHGGHYTNYMDCLVPAVAKLADHLVIAISQRMRQSSESVARWAAIPNVEFAEDLPEVAPELNPKDRYQATRNLMRCLQAVRPDFTLIPSADAQSTGVALLNLFGYDVVKRYGPIEGTIHYGYGYAAKTWKNKFKERVYSGTYRRLPYSSVNFVNFTYHDYAIREGLVAGDRLRFVGDPVPQPPRIGKAAARALLGLEQHGRYIGLLGSLDHRKAVPQVLAAFRLANLGPDDRLLLAGRLDPSYATLVATDYKDLVTSGRILVQDRFLSAAELQHGYEALDLATVAYSKSPVLASLGLKAVSAGTPIVADDFGWLGEAVRRFDLGAVTDIYDAGMFAEAIVATLGRGRPTAQSEPVRRLLEFHTVDNFVSKMTSGLRQYAGRESVPLHDWQWVLDSLPKPALTGS